MAGPSLLALETMATGSVLRGRLEVLGDSLAELLGFRELALPRQARFERAVEPPSGQALQTATGSKGSPSVPTFATSSRASSSPCSP